MDVTQKNNLIYLSCTVALVVTLVYKFRHLRGRWGNARVWTICAVLLWGLLGTWFAAPVNQRWFNQVVGAPNAAMLVLFCCTSAVGASSLALGLVWRYPVREAWLRFRWYLAGYGVTIVVMVVLFLISPVQVERPVDFDLYYATEPTAAALCLLRAMSLVFSCFLLAFWCLSWSRSKDYANLRWLRWSLWLYAVAMINTAVSMVVLEAALVGRWFGGRALDYLLFSVNPPLVVSAVILIIMAFLVPVWGRRWPRICQWVVRWRATRVLRPLHRELRRVAPDVVFVASSKRRDPHHRVRRMVIELSDWRWMLAPLFDPAVRTAAERLGRQAGLGGRHLAATVEAAQLKAALRAWKHGARAGEGSEAGRPARDEEIRDGSGFDDELAWWLPIAGAYAKSRVVTAAIAE